MTKPLIMNTIARQFPGLILFVGKSKSGKTYLLQYLLQFYTTTKKIFNFGLVLTGSPYNHEYNFLPNHAVREYDEVILTGYINELKKRKDAAAGGKLPASFLVLDDCLGLVTQSSAWKNLISTYRHLNITLFLSVQYLRNEASSTLVREQTSILFAFKSTNINTIKALYEYYGSDIFSKLDEFKKRYSCATDEKHTCMIYIADDQMQTSDKNLLSFKAPEFRPIKLKF